MLKAIKTTLTPSKNKYHNYIDQGYHTFLNINVRVEYNKKFNYDERAVTDMLDFYNQFITSKMPIDSEKEILISIRKIFAKMNFICDSVIEVRDLFFNKQNVKDSATVELKLLGIHNKYIDYDATHKITFLSKYKPRHSGDTIPETEDVEYQEQNKVNPRLHTSRIFCCKSHQIS